MTRISEIDRLNAMCGSTADPDAELCVRLSDRRECLYEVYQAGYGQAVHFCSAAQAEQYIRQYYAALVCPTVR